MILNSLEIMNSYSSWEEDLEKDPDLDPAAVVEQDQDVDVDVLLVVDADVDVIALVLILKNLLKLLPLIKNRQIQ